MSDNTKSRSLTSKNYSPMRGRVPGFCLSTVQTSQPPPTSLNEREPGGGGKGCRLSERKNSMTASASGS